MQARAKTAGVTSERIVLCFGRGFVGDRHNVESLNESSQTQRLLDVRFGSLADPFHYSSLMAAFGGKADIRRVAVAPFEPFGVSQDLLTNQLLSRLLAGCGGGDGAIFPNTVAATSVVCGGGQR